MTENNIEHNNPNAASSEGGAISSTPPPGVSKSESGLVPNTPPSLISLTQFVYFCQGLSFFFGITAIVGICVNYLKRDAVKGTIYESHFLWQIKTFWIGLVIFFVGWLTAIFLVGFFFIVGSIVWSIYRSVKGFLLLLENKPIPDPNSLL